MTLVEFKLNLTRAIVLIAVLIALSLVPVLSHNFVTGIFGSPEVQQNLKNNPIGQQGLNAILSNYNFYSYAEWYGANYNFLSIIVAIVMSFLCFQKTKNTKPFTSWPEE